MVSRQELKFLIHHFDYIELKSKLKHILSADTHSEAHDYHIKSLYFDDIFNSAYYDKIDGVGDRVKYRIRQYNHSLEHIKLEKKIKKNDRVKKIATPLTHPESMQLIQKEYEISPDDAGLLQEFKAAAKMKSFGPKVIVSYDREAYTFPINKVRITFDKHLRTHLHSTSFFDSIAGHHVLPPNTLILEVKYDQFLPGFIRQQFNLDSRPQLALSKYVMCRDGVLGQI